MQIDLIPPNISSPFQAKNIIFSSVGAEGVNSSDKIHPQESLVLTGDKSFKWKEEYSRGRLSARLALEKLGLSPIPPILKGGGGEPIWPVGIVGSISHSSGIGVACVARSEHYQGLGVDIENHEKKRQLGIFKKIASEKELAWIYEDETSIQKRGVLIFSIKEAIYKAMYGAFKVRLKYMDAEVLPKLEASEADVVLLKDEFLGLEIFAGFRFEGSFVVSGVSV